MQNRRSLTSTKIFVGSLPVNATADDLRKLFSPYGVISECDIANRCGFLHLEDKDLAIAAIQELNNAQFMGGRISVEMGRPKSSRGNGLPPRGGGKMRGGFNGMGRDRRPYSTDYGNRSDGGGRSGPSRPREFERNYYRDTNSEFTPSRNNDRTLDSYGERHGGMGMPREYPSASYDHSYSDNRNTASSYQIPPNDNGYSMGDGGQATSVGLDNNRRIAGDGTSMYDNRGRGNMYDERPVISGIGPMDNRLIMDQGVSQSNHINNYGGDYSRRDPGQPTQLMSNDGYSDRAYGSSHVTADVYPSYSMPQNSRNNDSGYQMSSPGGYGDNRQLSSASPSYGSAGRAAYGSSADSYGPSAPQTSGGYGDSYGQRAYESTYPPMQHQRDGYAATYEQPSNYHY